MNVTELIARLREDYCSCSEGYTSRQLIDPHCESCNTKDWRYDAADALEAQAREIADLQAGWQRTYDHDVARLQERLAAAERPCKTYDKDGKLLTVCHDLVTAERERDEAVALLREIVAWRVAIECVAPELGGVATTLSRIDAFLAADSATHRENANER